MEYFPLALDILWKNKIELVMQRMRNISHLILEAKQHKHKPHQFLAQPTNKKKHQQDSKTIIFTTKNRHKDM